MEDNMQKWVTALRSGKFQQCQAKLYDGNGYCCLGVLAEVTGIATIGQMVDESDGPGGPNWIYDQVREMLVEAGFQGDNDFIDANDCWGLTFEDIASAIENNGIPLWAFF